MANPASFESPPSRSVWRRRLITLAALVTLAAGPALGPPRPASVQASQGTGRIAADRQGPASTTLKQRETMS